MVATGYSQNDGDVRLVDGASIFEGRLEVFHDNTWGTVCNDLFGQNDRGAEVACRQLGYFGGELIPSHRVKKGVEPTWLDNVQCSGSEQTISECPHNEWGVEDCGHSEDVGVRCEAPPLQQATKC